MKTYVYICSFSNSINFAVRASTRKLADEEAEDRLIRVQMEYGIALPSLNNFEVIISK